MAPQGFLMNQGPPMNIRWRLFVHECNCMAPAPERHMWH
jgi:hypothetical protein